MNSTSSAWPFVIVVLLLIITVAPIWTGHVHAESSPDRLSISGEPVPVQHEPGEPLPPLDMDIVVVGLITLGALILFATEWVPLDITAIGVMIALILGEPWTGISVAEGISGFSSTATITVLCMFIIGEGVRRTGVIHVLGNWITRWTGNGLKQQLGAISTIVAPSSGVLNNTAVVAILLPMVTNIAEKCKRSPSKLLIPLSYASMFGGMLTLIGTSTNLLASDLSYRLLGRPIGMFEFTHLGLLITVVGVLYLVFVVPYLLTDRIKPESRLTDRYELEHYLTRAVVRETSPLIGKSVEESFSDSRFDADIIQVVRGDSVFIPPMGDKEIQAGDQLVIRSDQETLIQLLELDGLDAVAGTDPDQQLPSTGREEVGPLVEVIIAPGSSLVGESLSSTSFRSEYDASVLAIKHGKNLHRTRMEELEFTIGDTLLIQAQPDSLERLRRNPDLIVAQELEVREDRWDRIPHALTITAGFITATATGLMDIVPAALSGALLMVLTGCLRPREMYRAVRWDIIFLLASLIPLGIAMEYCGAADLIAGLIVQSANFMPPVAVLGILYFLTAFLTNLISNNASVLLMIPIAIDTAMRMGSNPFAFLLAVTFAASTAFMTPMGYQTNLFVLGPGGYRFRDFLWAGTPLQIITGIVTTLGIAYWWPL